MSYELMERFSTVLPAEAIVMTATTPVSEGDYVKIGVKCTDGSTEKFWAMVTSQSVIELDRYLVCIDQDLRLTDLHGLKDKDELVIRRKHIVGVIRP